MINLLELRLERVKRVSDLRLEQLERRYDRRPIGELYLDGNVGFRPTGT